ncbi:unnamed protein product [Cuscuta campestris]|uniref:Uncharacterized protein n=1 Tax=Cuscuta campestris TaxID=132261 RepID=A0A484L5Q2_9ASTE|nr:unnamed protein product [Cuscuta campestris]
MEPGSALPDTTKPASASCIKALGEPRNLAFNIGNLVNVVTARFVTLRDEASKNGLNVTDQQIWYSLVQGHNAKNWVSGVGDYELQMRKLKSSSTRRRCSSSASSKTGIEALKEQNQRLQEHVDALTSKFTTIQENLKRLYGGNHPPQDDDSGTGGEGQPRAIC